MSTVAAALRPIPFRPWTGPHRPRNPAFMILRIAFTVAPIVFGLDKFAEVLNNDWTAYLATEFNDILPGSAQDGMYIVGVVEIVAASSCWCDAALRRAARRGLARRDHRQLLLVGGYGDIAMRDFGLCSAPGTLAAGERPARPRPADALAMNRGAGVRNWSCVEHDRPAPARAASTHEVTNQPPPLEGHNAFDADPALGEALDRDGGGWGLDRMRDLGALVASPEAQEHSRRATRNLRSWSPTTGSATGSTASTTTRPGTG